MYCYGLVAVTGEGKIIRMTRPFPYERRWAFARELKRYGTNACVCETPRVDPIIRREAHHHRSNKACRHTTLDCLYGEYGTGTRNKQCGGTRIIVRHATLGAMPVCQRHVRLAFAGEEK